MKKYFIGLISLCLLLGLCTACKQEEQQTEPSPENTEPSAAIGGSQHCEMHNEQYHQFLSELTEPLDHEEIVSWVQAITDENKDVVTECTQPGVNIKTFVDRFQIPRETFEAYCNSRWACVHNIDLLYSASMEDIEAYYQDVDKRSATSMKQERLRRAKSNIITNHTTDEQLAGKSEEERAAIEKEVEFSEKVSMLRLIQLFQVEKAELDEAIEEAAAWIHASDQYDYQFDLAYNEDGTLKDFTIDPDKTVVELDAQFAGVDNFFTD